MRIVFAGTPGFAAAALLGLVDAGHEIALVLTQPDRPAGRGMKLAASEVKQFALRHRLSVFQPQTLKSPDAQERIRAAGAEAMVVAAYGLILPPAVLYTNYWDASI
jgi:methionyl-tRNA formyltransferase